MLMKQTLNSKKRLRKCPVRSKQRMRRDLKIAAHTWPNKTKESLGIRVDAHFSQAMQSTKAKHLKNTETKNIRMVIRNRKKQMATMVMLVNQKQLSKTKRTKNKRRQKILTQQKMRQKIRNTISESNKKTKMILKKKTLKKKRNTINANI